MPQMRPPMWLACDTCPRWRLFSRMALTTKKPRKRTMVKARTKGHAMDSKLTMRSATKRPMKPNTAPDAPTSSRESSNTALMKFAPTPAPRPTVASLCHARALSGVQQ